MLLPLWGEGFHYDLCGKAAWGIIMAYEKLLNEIYAVVSLKYLWPEYRPGFVKSECPDWVNESMGLGLEVSQALLPDDGETESFLQRYLGCRKEELPPSAAQRYGDRLHFYNGRFWAILPQGGSAQDYLYKAQYRFDRKLEKLNTHYHQLGRNGLYLYLHPSRETDIDAGRLFEYMRQRQEKATAHFDLVFLNCREVLFVCDFRADRVIPIRFPDNALTFLNAEAERLRHGREWPEGAALE